MRRLVPAPEEELDLLVAYGRLAPAGPRRSAVRANMIASVDGAASAGGLSGALGGPGDKAVFAALRGLADVIMVGSGTMRAERYGPARLDERVRAQRSAWGVTPVPPIAVVTASCRLDWQEPFFSRAEERPLVITVRSADPANLEQAAQVADVIMSGDRQVDLAVALDALAERGLAQVLAEGGPTLLGQLASAGLLDELCLTLSPKLFGGAGIRILTGPGIEPVADLRLVHVLEDDSFLFLRYQRPLE
jgi:riboflavin biosynthesis pyrimidine reductase